MARGPTRVGRRLQRRRLGRPLQLRPDDGARRPGAQYARRTVHSDHHREWGRGWRVVVANLDGNTSADLLFYNPASGIWQEAFNNDGAGRFALRTGAWVPGLDVHPTDLDGDGRDDVFAYNPTDGHWITALNLSAGRFASTSGSWTLDWTLATGDLTGDGRGDVVLYDPVIGFWFECITLGPGVFTYRAGSWLAGAALISRVPPTDDPSRLAQTHLSADLPCT